MLISLEFDSTVYRREFETSAVATDFVHNLKFDIKPIVLSGKAKMHPD